MISLCCSAAVSTQYEQRTLEYEAVRAAHLNRYSRTHHAIRLCATPAEVTCAHGSHWSRAATKPDPY